MKNNLVSVCITTYNRKEIFPLTLNSVIKQNYKDIEIIVVDDCSNDGTQDLIENEILKLDHRIKYIRHNKNKGLAAARNTAIFSADGKYFTFCDDDDLWEPNFIEEFVKEATAKDDNWCFCCSGKYQTFFGKNIEPNLRYEGDLKSFVKKGFTPPVASQFYNLKSLKKVNGYNENIKSGVDHDLWIRLSRLGSNLKYLPKALSNPNSNIFDKRMTTNDEHRINEIKNSLVLWKEDLTEMYGEDYYFKFHNAYIYREQSKYFKTNLKKFNIIKIIRNISLKLLFKMIVDLMLNKIFINEKTITTQPTLKI